VTLLKGEGSGFKGAPMMRRTLGILLGLLICFTINPHFAVASNDGMDMLKKSDDVIFPDKARFSFRMEDYENQQPRRYYFYYGYLKGNDRYLLVGLEPALVKGTASMRTDDAIFNYLKKIDVLQQVSAKVAFGNSTLTQEDVMGGKLENYYNVESLEATQENGKNLAVLTLTAKSNTVAYQKIVNFLDPATYFPVKRFYYAFSGQQIREMVFEDVQLKDGKLNLMKFTMYDSLRKGWFTKTTMSDFDYSKAVPDTIFTRMYLKLATK
jgi:hypothetical protein